MRSWYHAPTERSRTVWRSGAPKKQTILRRDVGGYRSSPDLISLLPQTHGPHDINRQRTVEPAVELASIADGQIVTAGQHGDARARRQRPLEHDVGQPAACMARDDDVGAGDLDVRIVHSARDELDAAGEPRPRLHQHVVQLGRSTAAATCRPRWQTARNRRAAASPARAGRVRRQGRRRGRRGTAGERASPSPTPRTAPCAAGSRHGRRPGRRDETACRLEIAPDRDPSGGRWMRVRRSQDVLRPAVDLTSRRSTILVNFYCSVRL